MLHEVPYLARAAGEWLAFYWQLDPRQWQDAQMQRNETDILQILLAAMCAPVVRWPLVYQDLSMMYARLQRFRTARGKVALDVTLDNWLDAVSLVLRRLIMARARGEI